MKKIVTVTIILLGLVLLTVMSFYPPIAERVNQWIASAGILGAVLLAVLGNHFSDLFKGSSPDSQSQGTTTTANVYDTEGAITKHLKFYDECYGRDELAETLFKKLNADSGCSVHAILADAGMGKSAFLAKCSASFKKYKSSGDLVLFYPFRASDPVLNKPRNLYLHLLKELGEIGLQGSPSASELNRKLHSKLQKWGEVNEGKKIFILVDAIEEAETPSEIPKEEESHPMPILFEDGHQHLSHCRLLFTVRGKSGQPVSGQVTHQWFNSTKKEKILKLDPIDDAGLQEWVFDSLPTTFFDDEKKQLQEAILNKTKETDHYPLYINHILQEICAIKGENSTFKEISEFVQTLPCSLVDYATEKFRRMRRGRDRETITLLACAKDLLAQSILGIRKNSLPSNIARWVMLSAGSDGKAEFQHALYKQWFEEHVRSLPPWWCPIASVWKWRAKLPSCFSIRRVSSKLPPRLALWRVKMFGTPYEKTHRKLAQLCADKNSRYDQKHLIYHSVESGDWKTVHDKLTDLGYIEERAKAGQTYELLDDYNHALDNWPGYERYSPFKEYHVPKWEQKLILTRIKVILTRIKERGYPEYAGNGKWPTDGHKETCLRMLFADHCSHNEIDPFAEAMEKCLEGRVELFFQFVRECASAIAHAKEFPTVVVEQALRRSKTGIVASVAKKISDKWDRDKKPYLRYLEYSREEKVASRPYTLLNLEGHSSGVYHVALTPDGKRAVSASWDNTLKVWDLESGACLKTLEGHSGGVNHVAITPDGERAVSASNDKTLKVWDLDKKVTKKDDKGNLIDDEPLKTLEGHSGGVNHVALTHDGKRAVSASGDNTLKVWDLESGDCLKTLEGHSDGVNHVALTTPDGKRAVSASEDNTLKVWDLESGDCLKTLEGHSKSVSHVALTTPDGKRAVSVSDDDNNILKVWDLESGNCLKTLKGHSDKVSHVALTPDGKRAVSERMGHLKVWDLESGDCLKTLEGHTDEVRHVALTTPDGKRAVLVSWDKIKVWDLESGNCLKELEGHTDEVRHVAITPDGKRAVSASKDNTLKVWDLESGYCLKSNGGGFSCEVLHVALTPDGKRAVSASDFSPLKVWDLESWDCIKRRRFTFATHVAITPDGKRAVSAKNYTLEVWDLESGGCPSCLDRLSGDHAGFTFYIAITPDGKRVFSARRDKNLLVWDLENKQSRIKVSKGHSHEVTHVALTPDGKRAVSASDDKTLKVWDLESGDCLKTLEGHSYGVNHVALTPDGKRAVSASGDKTLKVWDLESGNCLKTLKGHSDKVSHVSLTPDGKRAVSASGDKTLKVWDLESGDCLKTLEGHSYGVNHVTLTPDGKRAVSASNDKTLKVWDLESGKLKNSFFCKGIKALCWNGEGDLIVAEVDGLTLRFAKIRLGSQNTLFFANALYASEEKAVYYCPHCGAEQSVPPRALTCIEGLKKQNPTTYEKGHSPCIELPSEVWEAEGLLKDEKGDGYCCPSCKHPIRFNPWIVEEWTPADSSDAAKPSQGSDEDQGSSDVII